MIDFEEYHRKPLPPAALDQLKSMIGLNHWDLTDQQRTWLSLYIYYNSFPAFCLACGQKHFPLDVITDQFTFDPPANAEAFACPISGKPITLLIGGFGSSADMILTPKDQIIGA